MKETDENNKKYIEIKLEVSTYVDILKYALASN